MSAVSAIQFWRDLEWLCRHRGLLEDWLRDDLDRAVLVANEDNRANTWGFRRHRADRARLLAKYGPDSEIGHRIMETENRWN